MKVLLLAAVLAAASAQEPKKCKIPQLWGAFRVEFDPSQNPQYGFQNEGYYAYDGDKKRKWRAFINIEANRPPERLEVLSLYGEGKEYVTRLSQDLKPLFCQERGISSNEWYSHEIDRNAKWDGLVTLGETLKVEQWVSEVSERRPFPEEGFRYQTFAKKGCVPIRDDFRYEQFENITAIKSDDVVWKVPANCSRSDNDWFDLRNIRTQKGNGEQWHFWI